MVKQLDKNLHYAGFYLYNSKLKSIKSHIMGSI